jgi:hypothetical protein
MKPGHASGQAWTRLLVATALASVALMQSDAALAQMIAPCDLGGVNCSCPGCDAFLRDCAPQNLQTLPPVITPGQPQVPAVPPESAEISPDLLQPPPAAEIAPSALQPSPSALASSLGGSAGGAGIPSMIGDFFAGGYNYAFINNASVATAGGDRRFKFADNNNPFPQDRIFFNYNHFHNALTNVAGNDVSLDRYTLGIEKTLFSPRTSFEFRVPFAHGMGTNPGGGDPLVGRETEFGNIALAFKQLLAGGPNGAVSGGLGIVLPTGDDFSIASGPSTVGIPTNEFNNDAVHLLPFLGAYHYVTPRLFSQMFVQLDFDANGNDVIIAGQRGVLQDQALLFLDYSAGYWLYRNDCGRYFRAMAPMVELHYTHTLEDQDYGPFRGQGIFVQDFRRDVLNLTGGLFFQVGDMSSLKIGAVSPLREESDKLFDSEIGVQFTRRY